MPSKDLPEQFGRYRILRPLGEGGMGAVYLAEDTILRRRVALKVPHFSTNENPTVIERFHREARIAASIHHPNICAIHDFGEIDGIHYFTMPFIEGTPLSKLVTPQKPWGPRQAIELVHRVALALEVIHEHGIVHRDLKPGNILLDQSGQPVVMDFGLARSFTLPTRQLTRFGVAVGTPFYMSPEQLQGNTGLIGPGTDIYSLGVLLYQLLTNEVPFEGTMEELYSQILHAEPTPPSSRRPGLDATLDALCLKALAKKPEERYSTMAAFAESLANYLKQTTGLSASPPVPESITPGTQNLPDTRPPSEHREPVSPTTRITPGPDHGAPTSKRQRIRLATFAGVVGLGVLLAIFWWFAGHGREESGPDETPTAITNSLGMKLVKIPPGKFLMGSPKGEEDRDEIEGPQHEVEITQPFYLGVHEVTIGQFRVFVNENGYKTSADKSGDGWGLDKKSNKLKQGKEYNWENVGWDKNDDHPAGNLSWCDAMAFCKWLSKKEGKCYELPTEAEWEYACRAGTTTPWWPGKDPEDLVRTDNVLDASARGLRPDTWVPIEGNDGYKFSAPVGRFQANPFGLHDMHGNVNEWCLDGFREYRKEPQKDPRGPLHDKAERMLRGGSWEDGAHACRSADRRHHYPGSSFKDSGFRVVLRITH